MLSKIDMESAMRRLAERRIEDAMKEGKFDRLEGMGKPIEIDPGPADENARLMWWALKILKQNDVLPHEVVWRKAIDRMKGNLTAMKSEAQVRDQVRQINELVHKLNTLGTNALPGDVAPVDVDVALRAFQERTK